MTKIDESWQRFSPEFPMQYEFLDNSIEQLYLNEAKQNKVFYVFSGVSIFLACMGIFGLATHSARQRQRELGIRKILGASIQQIMMLISKEFIGLVLIATAIAIPVSWYFIKGWLFEFAYQINIMDNWPVFVFSGIAATFVVPRQSKPL